jgi:hypothetical protein
LTHNVSAKANPIKYVDPSGMVTNDPTIQDSLTENNQAVSVLVLNAISQFAEQKYMEYKGLSTTEKLSLIEAGAGLSPVPYAGDAVATVASAMQLFIDPSFGNTANLGFNIIATAIPFLAAGQLHLLTGVAKTSDVFNLNDFGKGLGQISQKTNFQFQGQSVYKLTGKMKIGDLTLKKGDRFYLDAMHKDHIEVFTSNGKLRTVLNLDGTKNSSKLRAARKENRTLDF